MFSPFAFSLFRTSTTTCYANRAEAPSLSYPDYHMLLLTLAGPGASFVSGGKCVYKGDSGGTGSGYGGGGGHGNSGGGGYSGGGGGQGGGGGGSFVRDDGEAVEKRVGNDGPSSPNRFFGVSVFAARTLDATDQPRVTLSHATDQPRVTLSLR